MTPLTPAQNTEILQTLGYVADKDKHDPSDPYYWIFHPIGYATNDGRRTEQEAWAKAPTVSTDLQITMIEIPAWLKKNAGEHYQGIAIIDLLEAWEATIHFMDTQLEEPGCWDFNASSPQPAAAIASAFYQFIQTMK